MFTDFFLLISISSKGSLHSGQSGPHHPTLCQVWCKKQPHIGVLLLPVDRMLYHQQVTAQQAEVKANSKQSRMKTSHEQAGVKATVTASKLE